MAWRQTESAVHHGEPWWRWRQYRNGSRSQIAGGRLHAFACEHRQRGECDALSKTQVQFPRELCTPVGSIGVVPNVLVVHPNFPAKTLPEFIEAARNKPGAIAMGLPGNGSPQHLAAALFTSMSKTEFLFVQYQGGGPVLKDLIGGHIQAAFASSVSSTANIKSGTLRALAVTSAARLPTLPDVPSIGELVGGYEATNFYGISAPKGTPAAIVAQLNHELNAALKDDAVIARLDTLGIGPVAMTPSAFGEFLASETKKWGDVIKSANIKMD